MTIRIERFSNIIQMGINANVKLVWILLRVQALPFFLSFHNIHFRDALLKKTVKKGDNPSSFIKPKFTESSNHSEMDF